MLKAQSSSNFFQEILKEVKEANPNFLPGQFLSFKLHLQFKNQEEALRVWQEIIQNVDENKDMVIAACAQISTEQGQTEIAKECFQQFLVSSSKDNSSVSMALRNLLKLYAPESKVPQNPEKLISLLSTGIERLQKDGIHEIEEQVRYLAQKCWNIGLGFAESKQYGVCSELFIISEKVAFHNHNLANKISLLLFFQKNQRTSN
eukprot:TRINITY_DN2502_c0_g1_i1.p1 TRINITY_DN2502_c0_g1~~TRINITY_DN2502_c0_g1_i1.p1  ORF type:complete len:204 (-),score=29.48 TRINITY_DN2502_c0_g1_i1:912-1523(-)